MCENCLENIDNVCQSITCDYYGIEINEIDETFCIHKKVVRDYDEEGLFDE